MADPAITSGRTPVQAGTYPDMSFEDYLAADAVSCGQLCTLLDSFPARLLHEIRQTPALEDGRIAHRLVLEGVDDLADSSRYIVVPSGFSMSHVKKHAGLIERINATGATPISEDRAAVIRGMHKALLADPTVMAALSNGRPEVSVFWQDDTTGVMCRARFDYVPNRGQLFPDYKTTVSVDPVPLSRAIANFRLAHRSSWYQRAAIHGLGRNDPARPPLYVPIWQEKTPPHFVCMQPCEDADIELAGRELDQALKLYAYCKETGVWPGPKHFTRVPLPTWERRRLEDNFGGEAATSEDWSDAA